MSEIDVRTIDASERDAVLDLLAGWLNDRGFFARYFQHDPAFRDDLCFVAVDGFRMVSCLQVFRKAVRVGDAVLDVGGIGNVYTDPGCRGRGLASALLRQAIGAMEEHGFDVSLLFATRLAFYGQFGWQSHARHLTFIARGAAAVSGQCQIERFDADRDLDEVMRLYDLHCAAVSGTTVRDPGYWLGQLRYAGNPDETFLVARAGRQIVAYARSTTLYDFHVILEHACLPGSGDALADLLCALHGGAAHLPGTLAQLSCEEGIDDMLRRRGLSLRTVEDVFWMWRLIDPTRVAAKLRLPASATREPDFFARLFPAQRSVYWFSDRF